VRVLHFACLLKADSSKYMELLIYDARFGPPTERLCEHAEEKQHVTRVMHLNGCEIHIRLEQLA
jgi:hypothetical protein